uniref:Uncharacterized protein n=1 Tax=Anguilla anguilla TaxID=7936 RepID=A0A0E9SC78_ANGAN
MRNLLRSRTILNHIRDGKDMCFCLLALGKSSAGKIALPSWSHFLYVADSACYSVGNKAVPTGSASSHIHSNTFIS